MQEILTKPLDVPSDGNASGHMFDENDLSVLQGILQSGVLNVTRGSVAKQLEAQLGEKMGFRHVHCCNSGTAAVHAAIAALDLEPGTEVITTPLTDFGGVAPILWQGCIPVFADIDPHNLIITAEAIRAVLSDRTGAIIVTHLFGNAAGIDYILDLARTRGLPVIEDCAQAIGTLDRGRQVGDLGDLACFSMQQTKQISTGEGGFVASNNPKLAARVHQFMNKSRNYDDPWPDHHFLSMNFRMTELQAAVALPQLARIDEMTDARRAAAAVLDDRLARIPGLTPITCAPQVKHSYWRYAFHVDPGSAGMNNTSLGAALKKVGISNGPRYQSPAMEWTVMRERKTFGNSGYPFTLARPEALDYDPARWPGLAAGQNSVLVLPWTARHTPELSGQIADMIELSLHEFGTAGA